MNEKELEKVSPLPYLFISVKEIELEKVAVSDIEDLSTVKSLTVDDKYSLPNRDNLTQPILMELSKKPKHFWKIFSAFLKSRPIFEHFEKLKN